MHALDGLQPLKDAWFAFSRRVPHSCAFQGCGFCPFQTVISRVPHTPGSRVGALTFPAVCKLQGRRNTFFQSVQEARFRQGTTSVVP